MPRNTQPNKLKTEADERGLSVLDLITTTISGEGSKLAAARKLGVSQATIQYHLRRAGIEVEIVHQVIFREVKA